VGVWRYFQEHYGQKLPEVLPKCQREDVGIRFWTGSRITDISAHHVQQKMGYYHKKIYLNRQNIPFLGKQACRIAW